MNWWDALKLYALGNLLLCSGIGWVCLCRLRQMSTRTRPRFIGLYALILTAATASGFQPVLFGEWPGIADLVMSATLLLFLGSGLRAWHRQAPDYTTRPEWLDTDQMHQVGGGVSAPQEPLR